MKASKVRVIVALVICAVVAVGYVVNTGLGTISAFGLGGISLLCPLGSLTTLLAEKTFLPRVLIALIIALVGMALLGRFFCGWVCPVPLVKRIPDLFRPKSKQSGVCQDKSEVASEACTESASDMRDASVDDLGVRKAGAQDTDKPHVESACVACSSKSACKEREHALDSRHFVLLGALLSATIFGFPVFCLICPIGLTFATIFLVISLFASGDITWSLIVVPVLLILELLVFKKWCHVFCPLSAFMSLMSRKNKRVMKVSVDKKKCIEANGGVCGRCVKVCPEGIDPHNIAAAKHVSECTKCYECVDACPAQALSIPLLAKAEQVEKEHSSCQK
jgi:ferredoxin-type protein NapH